MSDGIAMTIAVNQALNWSMPFIIISTFKQEKEFEKLSVGVILNIV